MYPILGGKDEIYEQHLKRRTWSLIFVWEITSQQNDF